MLSTLVLIFAMVASASGQLKKEGLDANSPITRQAFNSLFDYYGHCDFRGVDTFGLQDATKKEIPGGTQYVLTVLAFITRYATLCDVTMFQRADGVNETISYTCKPKILVPLDRNLGDNYDQYL